MKSRRAIAAIAALALAFLGQASCAPVLGIDADGLHDVIADMCGCPALAGWDDCEGTLGERLDGGAPTTREAWLARYEAKRCDQCENLLECLSTKPTCIINECSRDVECCPPPGDTKGSCDHGICKR